MTITHNFGVLNVTNAVKEREQIALRRVERQIADVKTRRRDVDRFRFPLRPRFALLLRSRLMLLLAVTRLRNWFDLASAVSSKKCGDLLPECFLLGSWCALFLKTSASAPTSRPAAPMALASPALVVAAAKIRNSKLETNPNEQSSKSTRCRRLGYSNFEFHDCFGFRISDFDIVPSRVGH